MIFDTLLRRHGGERPHATALIDGDRPLSYAQLIRDVDRVAALLHEKGSAAR